MLIPKPIRKWLAIFRGEVSPVLLLLSVLLGFWFGLTPGFYGLHVALLVLALIVNTHIGLFLLAAALGKSLSLVAAPVLYHLGVFTQAELAPLLSLLAAIPIIGITDFSRYAVAGAVVAGPALGLVFGAGLAKSVSSYRKMWLKLEENSETFQRWREKKWVKLLDKVLLGKSAKNVRETLARRPKIVRRAGVALAVVVLLVAVVGVQFLTDDVLTAYAAKSLTALNGAEVNIERLSLKPFSGKLSATGVQVTDPTHPQDNRVSIEEFQAQASLYSLLLGKVVMDDLEISALKFDEPRARPGTVVANVAEQEHAEEEADWSQFGLADLDAAKLETYFKNAQKVTDTLAKVKPYLPEPAAAKPAAPWSVPEHYLEHLSAKAETAPSPRFIIRHLVLDQVELPVEAFADSTVECENLSDAPQAAGSAVTCKVQSNTTSDWMQIVSHYEAPEKGAQITAEFANIDLAKLQEDLNSKNPISFKGGRASAKVDGRAGRDSIDLGITVHTEDMVVESSGGGALGLDPQMTAEALKVLKNLDTTLRLVGPLTQPKLVFDVPALRKKFQAALLKAGKDQLAARLGDLIGDKLPIGEAIPKDLDIGTLGDTLGGLLDKDKPTDQKGADKKDDSSEEEKKDQGKDLLKDLGGLLGGDTSKDTDDDDDND